MERNIIILDIYIYIRVYVTCANTQTQISIICNAMNSKNLGRLAGSRFEINYSNEIIYINTCISNSLDAYIIHIKF